MINVAVLGFGVVGSGTAALITENADVIKGFFCGHRHSAFYTEIKATYTDEKGIHNATIPQWVEPGNPYLNHVGMVTRIIIR